MPKSSTQKKIADLEEQMEAVTYVLETLLSSLRVDGKLVGDICFPNRDISEDKVH